MAAGRLEFRHEPDEMLDIFVMFWMLAASAAVVDRDTTRA